MAKAYVIDGNSLLFRAYYATAYGPNPTIMKTKDGIPTNAIFAFSNMLNKILSNLHQDDCIFVGFDTGKATFRHKEDKDYKANRKECPEELKIQMPIAREFLKSLNIFTYEKEGYEADDLCGTYAKKAAKENYEVIIYTSDKDYLQLIDDNISIHLLKTGMSNITIMNKSNMKETYGFEPLQIIDFKALRGDSSDNLPGIPGVGDKTAVKLIQEYGNFESIYEAAKSMKSKVGQSIVENVELGRKCYHLAQILLDVDLPFSVEDTIYQGYEFDNVNQFANKYELKQFLNRLPSKLCKNNEQSNIEYVTVTSLKDIDIKTNKIGIALDKDSGNYNLANLYGIALTINGNSYYIDIENAKNDEALKQLLKSSDIKKYCFDFKAIKVMLNRFGIEINGLEFDALLAMYVIDTSFKEDVYAIYRYFGFNIKKEDRQISLFDNQDSKSSIEIAYYALKCAPKAFSEIEKLGCLKLFKDIDIKLAGVLAEMEIEGFPLDKNMLIELGKSFQFELEKYKNAIYDLAGEQFNIDSPKQVGDILFNKIGLKPLDKKMSTSVEVLNELRKYHPIVDNILQYRKYAKLMSTYVTSLAGHVKDDGKIHTIFNQALTSTGRLSSSEPNLQNISTRDEESKQIKKAFYYQDNNYSILSLDYSQIELRILASLSNCESLINSFSNSEDIHSSTAKKIFGIDNPTSEERRRAKAVNFGIIYGISDWGLAEQINTSLSNAKTIINAFYDAYPEVALYFKKVSDDAIKNGYVTTMLGRRRYLREVHDSNYQVREFARRAAMNAPIQGTAADLIKIAMIKIDEALKEKKMKTKMILQIHDELLFKVPSDEIEIAQTLIKDIMENALPLSVKLEVKGGIGHSWYDCK